MRRKLYNFSPVAPTGELNLRDWFDQIVYGKGGRIPHGRWVVLRILRRDSNGHPTYCTCRDQMTRQASPSCSYCAGEGYLWDESWVKTHSTRTTYFLRYDTKFLDGDKIVEMLLDQEGNAVVPYIRLEIVTPEKIQEMRSDHGRIEYIAVHYLESKVVKVCRE